MRSTTNETPTAAAERPAVVTFAFVVAEQSILRNAAAGGMLAFTLILAWRWWRGSLVDIDITYIAVLGGFALAAALFVGWRTLRLNRDIASQMGVIEVDPEGLCWRSGDGSARLEVCWDSVETITVDRNQRLILINRGESSAALIGYRTGYVGIDRPVEFERVLAQHAPVSLHRGAGDSGATKRLARLGALCMGVAATIYGVNTTLHATLGWSKLTLPMPVVVSAMGVLLLALALRLRAGKGPIASPVYGTDYVKVVYRFLIVAALADLVLMFAVNVLALTA